MFEYIRMRIYITYRVLYDNRYIVYESTRRIERSEKNNINAALLFI